MRSSGEHRHGDTPLVAAIRRRRADLTLLMLLVASWVLAIGAAQLLQWAAQAVLP
jgi:hypothetical protein